MAKTNIRTPFFVFNPKSYLFGEGLLELVREADTLAEEFPISIFVTAPFADIAAVSSHSTNIIVTAQHLDGIYPDKGMGHVLPESLYEAGARAVFLNHAEKPLTLSGLAKAITRAAELGIITIVCADSIAEAKAITMLNPDIVLCEPSELIGTGKTSDASYVKETIEAVKSLNPNVLVMQAAGISTADDVYRTILMQADGVGCTSGIVKAKDPKKMLRDMVEATVKASNENNK